MVWNKNQDLGISTLVHHDFYRQRWFWVKIYDPRVFKQKMVFQKTVGKRRLVDTHTKPKNRKDVNPIRYFQNLKISIKRHLIDTCKI